MGKENKGSSVTNLLMLKGKTGFKLFFPFFNLIDTNTEE